MKDKQSGFTTITITIVVLLVGLVVIATFEKVSRQSSNKHIASTGAVSDNSQPKNYPYLTQDSLGSFESVDTSGWPSFTKADAWFTFLYPSNWTLDNDTGAYKAKPAGKLFDKYTLRLTSTDGNHKIGYDSSTQSKGSQLQIDITYSASGIVNPVSDCKKDLPYRLITQIKGIDGTERCLVEYRTDYYGVVFDSKGSQVNVGLYFGGGNSTASNNEAIKSLIGIAQNLQVLKVPS